MNVIDKAIKWVDDNPGKKLEFYCEEGITKTNANGMRILSILRSDIKDEDELIQAIAKVQWHRLHEKCE